MPTPIVEGLSEGTERFDRGEEFEGYRSVATLRHCVMVSELYRMALEDEVG